MEQWPLPSHKLQALRELVREQLEAGHIEPSTSPYNSPVFIIKKKATGKYRLLHDLREINKHILPMGTPQPGLPHPVAIPKHFFVATLDIKDCFFSIPLHQKDRPRFAFTVPVPNHRGAADRYQWKVLPQGMRNSPAICQLYVNAAVAPLRDLGYLIHYMDDVLVACETHEKLQYVLSQLRHNLSAIGLTIQNDKVKFEPPLTFLGFHISQHVTPMAVRLNVPDRVTLTELQQLCGNINWVRPALSVTTAQLQPLFALLQTSHKPPSAVSAKIAITPEARAAIAAVDKALNNCCLQRFDPQRPLQALVLPTKGTPTGVLWQDGPLLWLHPSKSKMQKICPAVRLWIALAADLVQLSVHTFETQPAVIVWPLNAKETTSLIRDNEQMQVLCEGFAGDFNCHFPSHRLLQGVSKFPFRSPFFPFPSSSPFPRSVTIFTDASRTKYSMVVYLDGVAEPKVFTHLNLHSVQTGELLAIVEALRAFPCEPVNIFTDSLYSLQVCRVLALATFFPTSSPIDEALDALKTLLEKRMAPWYIAHIRSHSGLPGPLAAGNDTADQTVSALALDSVGDAINQAKSLHSRFHFSAASLHHLLPELPIETCKHLVRTCKTCAPFLPLGPLQPQGVNPRGLRPNSRWQMDVTHVPSFGRLKFLHVIIDTFSHMCYAVPLPGETAKHCIKALRQGILFMGVPWDLKTDNGPAYRSESFARFLQLYQIAHHFGIPYNPQGQAIVESSHRRLKQQIEKQREILPHAPPGDIITAVLIHLNLLTFDKDGLSAVHRHWGPSYRPTQAPLVLWKDPQTGQWRGPCPLLTQGRGFACVFPQDAAQPIWVPGRYVKPATSAADVPQGTAPDASDPAPTEPAHPPPREATIQP